MLNMQITLLLCWFLYQYTAFISLCSCEKRLQLSVEHPTITYVNPKFYKNFTLVARRYSRKDPKQYISIYSITNKEINNKYSINFDFYELLSNVYKPSFVRLHFDSFCGFLENDTILGSTMVSAYLRATPVEKRLKSLKCPYPPGEYVHENFTVPYTPLFKNFPFSSGRIFIKLIYDARETVVAAYVDMVMKYIKL